MHLVEPYELDAALLPKQPYAVWVLLSEKIPPAAQDAISAKLVSSGCRYAVASGPECTTWDDSIDEAAIQLLPDDEHIMTTWHDDDTIEEVAEFFALWTTFDDFVPKAFLILGLGAHARVEYATALVRAQLGRSAT
jgi:hypothetical protein